MKRFRYTLFLLTLTPFLRLNGRKYPSKIENEPRIIAF